jgi:hypothetical protein
VLPENIFYVEASEYECTGIHNMTKMYETIIIEKIEKKRLSEILTGKSKRKA